MPSEPRDLHGLPLFDRAESERRRDEGMKSADRHARAVDPAWRALFVAEACRLASCDAPFTTEDVLAATGRPLGADPRASGNLVKMLQREGLIEPTGEYRRARVVSRHSAPMRLWRGRRAA